MTYKLSEAKFVNDFYYLEIANGNTIVFNVVDEELVHATGQVNINAINVAVIDNDENYFDGVNIIGEGNDYYFILSDYKEYLGKPLTKDNIAYCTLEVADD